MVLHVQPTNDSVPECSAAAWHQKESCAHVGRRTAEQCGEYFSLSSHDLQVSVQARLLDKSLWLDQEAWVLLNLYDQTFVQSKRCEKFNIVLMCFYISFNIRLFISQIILEHFFKQK